MQLSLVTPSEGEVLDLAAAKVHLREFGDTQNALIESLIGAAREIFEQETGRQLLTATWEMHLDRFPAGHDPIRIPRPPLAEVVSITYVDSAGATQTWSDTEYTVRALTGTFARQGQITPKPDNQYPTTRAVPGAVTIRFTCGYGAAKDVPPAHKAALKVLLTELFENRDGKVGLPPQLLHRFRLPVYA